LLQVEAFLHGPTETFTLGGFSGISGARREASKIQGRSIYGYGSSKTNSSTPSTYSMTATAQGTGKNACVVIRKTRECYQLQVQAKQLLAQELIAVRRLVRVVPGAVVNTTAAAAEQEQDEHAGVVATATAVAPRAAPPAMQPVVDTIDLTDD
jgi:hypothetical protein